MGKKKALLKYEGTLAGAVSDAFSTIEELAGEMREAFENTPESLQNSGVGEARGEAADALEDISEPDVDAKFADLPVVFEYSVGKRRPSRPDRMHEGLRSAYVAIEELQAGEIDEGKPGYNEELEAERSSLIDEIQQMIDDAEAVTFPGMYG